MGIEPLRLHAAVQRLASVPSTHTGSVLLSRACHALDSIGGKAQYLQHTGQYFLKSSVLGLCVIPQWIVLVFLDM